MLSMRKACASSPAVATSGSAGQMELGINETAPQSHRVRGRPAIHTTADPANYKVIDVT
jgi:hypothetical protein